MATIEKLASKNLRLSPRPAYLAALRIAQPKNVVNDWLDVGAVGDDDILRLALSGVVGVGEAAVVLVTGAGSERKMRDGAWREVAGKTGH